MVSTILVMLYFCLNSFLAGYYLADNWSDSRITKTLRIIQFILFGALIYLMVFPIKWILIKIDDIIQLRFWFTYLFTRKYYNLPEHVLDRSNNIIKSEIEKGNKSIKFKYHKYLANLVNKRNNYKHK